MLATMTRPFALEGFSTSCPSHEEVTAVLAAYGFHQVLTLAPRLPRRGTPALPAQYHYQDRYETEVIYLAGYDTPEEGQHFPPHASRWWVYPSSSSLASSEIVQTLRVRYPMRWRRAQE